VAVLRDKLSEVAKSEAARDPPPEWALLDGVDRTVSRALGGYEPLSVWPVIASILALMFAPPLGLLLDAIILVRLLAICRRAGGLRALRWPWGRPT